MSIGSQRNKREAFLRWKREGAGDYYFDKDFTEINYEYDELSEEERALMEQYEDEDPVYDYSQFENYNNVNVKKESMQSASLRTPEPTGAEMPTQNGPGQIHIQCKLNMASMEEASINVIARVYTKTLIESYKGVAQFELPSQARLDPQESVRFVGSGSAAVLTKLSAEDPGAFLGKMISNYCSLVSNSMLNKHDPISEPGQSVNCGDDICDRYADCLQSFRGEDKTECRCLPGFKGDGTTCDRLSAGIDILTHS